jgi:two-component system response regulator RegX3
MVSSQSEGRVVILVADTDGPRRRQLADALEREGFVVDLTDRDAETLERFRLHRHAVVLLDIQLPVGGGVALCGRLRDESGVPLIVMCSTGDEADVVAALEMGADDCITQPARQREVVARVRAALRRAPQLLEPANSVLEVGDVTIDPAGFEVVVRGERVAFPLKEFGLLALLMANAGRTLTRSVLVDRVWGTEPAHESKTLDSHIRRIRAKIEIDPSSPTRVVTVRGLGYRFNRPR